MRTRSKGSLSTLGIALVAMLALGALFGSASAAAATQHWYGYAGGTPLAQETPTEVTAEDAGGVDIKFLYSGVELDISCNSMSADGSIENPSGGGAGALSGTVLTLDECEVVKPGPECTIPSTLETVELKGEATKFEGVPAIKYSPKEGTVLTTFSITGGGCSGYIGTKYIAGSFMAKYQGSGGNYEVTMLSSAGLSWAKQPVKLVTHYELSSTSEEAVALVSDTPSAEHWYLGGAPAEGAKTKLAEGSTVGYSSVSGSMAATISMTAGGTKFTIQCGGPSSGIAGSVENPGGGGAGTATGTMTFAGCTATVNGEAGACSVQGGGATSSPLSGLTTESGGAPAVTLSAPEKTGLVTLVVTNVSGCPAAFVGTKKVQATLTGVPNPFGTYTILGAGVKYGAIPATLSGQATLETSAGERLGIEP